MSTGSAAIPLLKAAPEPDQLADRLVGGRLARPRALPRPGARRRRRRHSRARSRSSPAKRSPGATSPLTAEAPVAWPSGAFVRVDRLDDEARAGSSAAPSSPPRSARRCSRSTSSSRSTRRSYRAGAPSTRRRSSASCASTREACVERGVTPLIENVPPVLRMRTGGVFLSPDRRPLARPARLARARPGARLHARHLPRRAVPLVRRRLPVAVRPRVRRRARARALRRGARARRREVAHVSDAARPARRGPPLRQPASSTSIRSCARLGELVPVHRRRDQRARPRPLART